MTFIRYFKAARRLAGYSLLLVLLANPAAALIEYTEGQRETIVELIGHLETRHYAGLPYGDELSSEHLDNYILTLDRGKMYFSAADIASFEKYRLVMDDELARGRLDAGFDIFNRFQKRLEGVRGSGGA